MKGVQHRVLPPFYRAPCHWRCCRILYTSPRTRNTAHLCNAVDQSTKDRCSHNLSPCHCLGIWLISAILEQRLVGLALEAHCDVCSPKIKEEDNDESQRRANERRIAAAAKIR